MTNDGGPSPAHYSWPDDVALPDRHSGVDGRPPFRSIEGLSGVLLGLGAFWTLLHSVYALSSFQAVDAYRRAASTGVDPQRVMSVHAVLGLSDLVAVPVLILLGLWTLRVRSNAVMVERDAVRRGAPWAWLAWILPVVSLWFPRQILLDAWGASAKVWDGATRRQLNRGTLNLWWGLWLGFAGLLDASGFADQMRTGFWLTVVPWLHVLTLVVMIAALVAWGRVVIGLNIAQDPR